MEKDMREREECPHTPSELPASRSDDVSSLPAAPPLPRRLHLLHLLQMAEQILPQHPCFFSPVAAALTWLTSPPPACNPLRKAVQPTARTINDTSTAMTIIQGKAGSISSDGAGFQVVLRSPVQ